MLEEFRIGDCIVEIDRDATCGWYAKAGEWNCSCKHCRNFIALAKTRRLPQPFLSLLDSLGIPPEKATYVCQQTEDKDKGLLYDFSCRIAGRIIQGKLTRRDNITCYHETYPYGAPGFPEPHFDLGLSEWLPWVLEESELTKELK